MADDLLNPSSEQGFPSDVDGGSPYTGNRPASGARRATPGEVLSQGFQGAQNAGDFLGLDTEFAGQDPNLAYDPNASLDLVAPPSTHDPATQGYDPGAVPAPAPMPEGDPVQEFAEAPSAFEFGGDLGSEEEGEFAPAEPSEKSRKPLLVAALFVGALIAGGLFYGPDLYARFFGEPTEVADAPSAAQPKAPHGAKAPGAAAQPTPDAPVASLATEPQPTASTPSSASATPQPAPVAPTPRSTHTEPVVSQASAPDASVPGASSAAPDADGAATQVASVTPSSSAFPDLTTGEYEWASSDQLELIWRGSEVPLEAVKAPAKTLMPRVGTVRVFTTTGDVFDGRLYAVGQNRVWLDTQPGRIGLDGDKVQRIEVLPPPPEGTKPASTEASLAAGSKRVRVRVPGGMLYGHVLKTEGSDVTLALDQGGRVHVKADEIEDLGPGRAKVVGR